MKNNIKTSFCLLLFMSISAVIIAQDTATIKVHFLYGSIPRLAYRKTEWRSSGGIMGGHVGIELAPNCIMDFMPVGRVHWVARRQNKRSKFAVRTNPDDFWSISGGHSAHVKKATVVIPVNAAQKQVLDSIFTAYTTNTPYDYAFIGMRCAAATHDVLSQMGIMPTYGPHKIYFKIFYPERLRKRLLNKARQENWTVLYQKGSERRRWDRD